MARRALNRVAAKSSRDDDDAAETKALGEAVQRPQTNAEWLSELLRRRIISGVYKPGQHLREQDFRTEFSLSNGPIREALQKLIGERLAVREPWRGVKVINLTPKQIVELFQVRDALFKEAASLAARRRPADLA